MDPSMSSPSAHKYKVLSESSLDSGSFNLRPGIIYLDQRSTLSPTSIYDGGDQSSAQHRASPQVNAPPNQRDNPGDEEEDEEDFGGLLAATRVRGKKESRKQKKKEKHAEYALGEKYGQHK